jgi:hypothetical protein
MVLVELQGVVLLVLVVVLLVQVVLVDPQVLQYLLQVHQLLLLVQVHWLYQVMLALLVQQVLV